MHAALPDPCGRRPDTAPDGQHGPGRDRPRPAWTPAPRRRGLRFALLLAGLVTAMLIGATAGSSLITVDRLFEHYHNLRAVVAAHELTAVACFTAGYVLLIASFLLPAAFVLTFAGGLLFGTTTGTLLAIFAATTGATLGFLMTRGALGGFVHNKLGRRGLAMRAEIHANGFAYLLALRFAPFVPFAVVTVAAGAAKLRVSHFILGTALGVTPATILYANLGESMHHALSAGRRVVLTELVTPLQLAMLTCLALLTAWGVAVRYRRQRRATARPSASAAG